MARLNTRRLSPAVIAVLLAVFLWDQYHGGGLGDGSSQSSEIRAGLPTRSTDVLLEAAFRERRNDYQIEGVGEVIHVLPDDTKGSQHQRFLLELDSGQTLLVAHNIDLAPRIESLAKGDRVRFYGEYEWTEKGGVIHWTHHDPGGRHPDGWLEHEGRRYE